MSAACRTVGPVSTRVGHAVSQLYRGKKTEIDDALIVALEIPPRAHAVSFGIDRVSLPLEEPRPRPVGRPPPLQVPRRCGNHVRRRRTVLRGASQS